MNSSLQAEVKHTHTALPSENRFYIAIAPAVTL